LGKITAPTGLTKHHDISEFDCGNVSLNEWLENKAISNDTKNASRCFVICDANRVIGYYALATGAVDRSKAPSKIKRNMPDPIPVLVLGRLAIDSSYQGQSLGSHLLKDCMLRAIAVSEHIAFKALLVHAISEDAKRFYTYFGFKESPIDPMTIFLSLSDIRQHLNIEN